MPRGIPKKIKDANILWRSFTNTKKAKTLAYKGFWPSVDFLSPNNNAPLKWAGAALCLSACLEGLAE